MNILAAIKMGLEARRFLTQIQKSAPEIVDVIQVGKEAIDHTLSAQADGKLTYAERSTAADLVESFGVQMADVIRTLPVTD